MYGSKKLELKQTQVIEILREGYIRQYAVVLQNYFEKDRLYYWVIHFDLDFKKPKVAYDDDRDYGDQVSKNPLKYTGVFSLSDDLAERKVKFQYMGIPQSMVS